MMKSLKIMLWDEEIGRLAWDERRHLSYFTYNPDFIRKGLNISPLVAPVDGTRGLLPVWGEEAKIYQKLPAFVADSLPDAWGNQLFDLWRQQQKISNSEINPLDKLSFIGRRGMGALEFIPETNRERRIERCQVVGGFGRTHFRRKGECPYYAGGVHNHAIFVDCRYIRWGTSAESDYCDKQRNRRDTKRSNCNFGRI